jgi:hypothetical protein
MGLFTRFIVSRTLAKLTNQCEIVLGVQQALISSGKVSADSTAYLHALESRIGPGMNRLCNHDKYLITEALLTNIRVATAFGRHDRVYAQEFLFSFLVKQGIAASLEDWTDQTVSSHFSSKRH